MSQTALDAVVGTVLAYRPEKKSKPGNSAKQYSPISSVWEGNDGDLIEEMLRFYATIPPTPILGFYI